jgi:hypothetical protein
MKRSVIFLFVCFGLLFAASPCFAQNNQFAPAVKYSSGGDQGRWVSVADVNGDGKPDLLVVNECGSNGSTCANSTVGVLLGNGDGTFQTAVTYASGGHGLPLSGGYGTVSLAVGDVNGDGKPDIVVANGCATSSPGDCLTDGTVGVLLGNGDGTFQTAVLSDSGGLYASTVVVADVNRDGKPDIVVANLCGTTCDGGVVGVLLGNGDGTFQPVVPYGSSGYQSYSVAVADVNRDGKPDLLVTNFCPASSSECDNHLVNGTVGVLLGNGNGTFQSAVTYDTGGVFARSVAAVDVNGDGNPDILVANYISNSVGVLLGNGDGTFRTAVTYASGGRAGSASLAVGDVNEDGRPDLVVASQCDSNCANGSVGVLLGNGDGTFQAATPYESGGASAQSVAVADVDGNGKPDLLVANFCASSVNCTNGAAASVGVLINTSSVPYAALVQQPINSDGSSIFRANRGVVPVKFTLTQNGKSTCALPPATISVTRTAGGTLGPIGEASYVSPPDNGSNFRIDTNDCQYIYNLAAKSLGVGTYRVDITINGLVVGSAVFELQ